MSAKTPDLEAFIVEEREGKDAFWHRIGAYWKAKDAFWHRIGA
jgi:hypothetical protein